VHAAASLDAFDTEPYLPAPQGVHEDAAAPAQWPGPHAVQTVRPGLPLKKPAEQEEHPAVALPAAPAPEPYLPGLQPLQPVFEMSVE